MGSDTRAGSTPACGSICFNEMLGVYRVFFLRIYIGRNDLWIILALCQVLGWDSYESRPVTIFKAFFTFLGSIFILGHDK